MSSSRRPIYFNDTATKSSCASLKREGLNAFHRSLPNYSPTPLVALPDLATELGIRGVYVKDESHRFGLPSFKILGASWGILQALSNQLSLPSDVDLSKLAAAARAVPIKLFAATDGNHGRAVAFMANLLSLQSDIFVPEILDKNTQDLIAKEGATIRIVSGDYDATVQKAAEMANATPGGLLVQDTSFPEYEKIPSWIVDGYSTMLSEVDQQLADLGLHSTIMITPVGVGSLAHAVARHCKSGGRSVSVVTVEPDTAACLYHSLRSGSPVSVKTSRTIMSGMDCGTVSLSAWDDLQNLVDASTTVSCFESHHAVEYLSQHGITSGPCGAASLAALRLLASRKQAALKLGEDTVVVLLSTEGARHYQIPLDVSPDEPTSLAQILATANSKPPPPHGDPADKRDPANYIIAWLEHRGIKNQLLETASGHPSAVRTVDPSGCDKSIVLTGRGDTGGDAEHEDINASLATQMISLLPIKLP